MSESMPLSLLALVGVFGLAFLAAHWLGRIRNQVLLAVLAVLCLAGTAASIFTVDVNLPLAASHLRPSGEPAPVWLALGAWFFRMVPVFLPFVVWLRDRQRRLSTARAEP